MAIRAGISIRRARSPMRWTRKRPASRRGGQAPATGDGPGMTHGHHSVEGRSCVSCSCVCFCRVCRRASLRRGSPSPLALAHEGATGAVKERMDLMEPAKRHEAARRHGQGQDAICRRQGRRGRQGSRDDGKENPDLFPEGSTGHPSDALPAIWQEWDHFTGNAGDLETKAGALAGISTAPASWTGALQKVTDVCKACHESFRAKRRSTVITKRVRSRLGFRAGVLVAASRACWRRCSAPRPSGPRREFAPTIRCRWCRAATSPRRSGSSKGCLDAQARRAAYLGSGRPSGGSHGRGLSQSRATSRLGGGRPSTSETTTPR